MNTGQASGTETETKVEPGETTRDGATKRFSLPSGKVAEAPRHLLGRHQRDAMRIVGKDMASLPFAIIAVVTTIDGRRVTYEELLDYPMSDTNALLGEVLGKDGT